MWTYEIWETISAMPVLTSINDMFCPFDGYLYKCTSSFNKTNVGLPVDTTDKIVYYGLSEPCNLAHNVFVSPTKPIFIPRFRAVAVDVIFVPVP